MQENLSEDWMPEDTDGQLSIDVYQDDHTVYLIAPVAGVRPEDINVSITDEVITIQGQRKPGHESGPERHFTQECYWGPFSRSYVLPIAVDSERSRATLKDGMLKIEVPKDAKVKTRVIKINEK